MESKGNQDFEGLLCNEAAHLVPSPECSACEVVLEEANVADQVKQAALPDPGCQWDKLSLHALANGHHTIGRHGKIFQAAAYPLSGHN